MYRRLLPVAALALAACSSSNADPQTIEDTAASNVDGGTDAPTHWDDTAAWDGGDTKVDAIATPDAADTKTVPDASAACTSFCKCMSDNCASKKFVVDCLTDCATQTNWDLPCRANMCSLVPAQPDNDHCTHAMGVDQCLAL